MIVKLLTEHHLEFLSLKGGCTGSSESTHVKIPHCWKYHALAQIQATGDIFLCMLKKGDVTRRVYPFLSKHCMIQRKRH